MNRLTYEAPVTECFRVELEGAMMSASIVDVDNKSMVISYGHETATAPFDVSDNFAVITDGEDAGFVSGWE